MKKVSYLKVGLPALLALSLFLPSCSDDDDNNTEVKPTITELVVNDPNFSILEAAVTRAGLGAALAGGSLTVFAPDNAAFQAIGYSEALINTLPVSRLDSILKYHVLGSSVPSSSVPASDAVKTLLGTQLYASNNLNGTFVNGIAVKRADIEARNGVVHVINGVLIPPTQTIAQIAAGNPAFSTLVKAVDKAGLLGAVSGPGKFTVFAPTNNAFTTAGITDLDAIPKPTVETVVKYHVINTNVFASDLANNTTAPTIQGGNLRVFTTPAAVKVDGSTNSNSNITATDIVATNGVIHVIDRTILP